MTVGLLGALFWAMETLLLTAALGHSMLAQTNAFSASLTAAAWHDLISAAYLLLYLSSQGKRRQIIPTMKSYGGRKIMLAALLGGPVGMTCYLLALQHAGASLATSVSAFYPAIGAFLSLLFLREHLRGYQLLGLLLSVIATALLGIGAGEGQMTHLGFLFALLCAVSWGSEAIISANGMRQSRISPELAIQLRQMLSGLTYILVFTPIFRIGYLIRAVIHSVSFGFLLLAALCGTASYLCYYQAIRRLGPSKAMAINITYTVWVIVLESIWKQSLPGLQPVLCAGLISLGSSLAVYETKHDHKKGVRL